MTTSTEDKANQPDIRPRRLTVNAYWSRTLSQLASAGWFWSALLGMVTVLLYLPVRQYAFVAYDDPDYVTDNPHVQAGLTWAGVKWAFASFHASNWHPVTWLLHMADASLFGSTPAGPHLVNVLLHAANALLLFALLRRCTDRFWASLIVAALFACHPLRVESVAWVAERKDVFSAFFFLLSLGAYARFASSDGAAPAKNRGCWYGIALMYFAFGLMSKPMLVTLPCVLLLLDFWPLRRLAWKNGRDGLRRLGRLLSEKIPFFALSLISSAVTVAAQRQGGAVRSLESFSWAERWGNAVVAYTRYLGKTIWPSELTVFYPHPGYWPPLLIAGSATLVVGLSAAVLYRWRNAPFLAVGWFWFLGMLVPTVGIVQVGNQSMADRYTYLPSIGLLIAVVWGVSEFILQPKSKIMAAALTVAIVALFAWSTARQLTYWQNSERLFARALAVTERNFVAHDGLGYLLLERGEAVAAESQFRRAIEFHPRFAEAHTNLGSALLQQGRSMEAAASFQDALAIQPALAVARYNLGTLWLAQGRTREAQAELQAAIALRPDDAVARVNLGNAFLQEGQFDEAAACYRAALTLQPRYADAHNNLGHVLLQFGQLDEAARHFQEAVKVRPEHANACYNLGDARWRQGRLEEAEAAFEEVVRLQPDDAEARSALGTILLQRGDAAAAARHFESAIAFHPESLSALIGLAWLRATAPDASLRNGTEALQLGERARRLAGLENPLVLGGLAAAYAETGRFSEAKATAINARQIAQAAGDAALASKLSRELACYEQGTPFRDVR